MSISVNVVLRDAEKHSYLLPDSRLAPKPLAAVLLRLSLCDLDDPAKQLALIHVVYRFFGISRDLKFHVAKSSVRILVRGEIGFWQRNVHDLAEREESIC